LQYDDLAQNGAIIKKINLSFFLSIEESNLTPRGCNLSSSVTQLFTYCLHFLPRHSIVRILSPFCIPSFAPSLNYSHTLSQLLSLLCSVTQLFAYALPTTFPPLLRHSIIRILSPSYFPSSAPSLNYSHTLSLASWPVVAKMYISVGETFLVTTAPLKHRSAAI
jgi:hypothetical protein